MKSDGVPPGGRVWMRWAFLAALGAGLVPLWSAPARADHSLGRACLSCHALRSTKVVPGSRNILSTEVQDPLYQTDFYCGPSWEGGEPLDCSYCHGSAGDIANEIALSNGGTSGSAHPVDVSGDSVSYPAARRIVCNDCHNGDTDNATNPGPDLVPETLCTKSATDGYPNHHSLVVGGQEPGANDLADNPPRLTAPYGPSGGAVSSGGGVDWTKGTLTAADLVCFICHDGDATTKPPYSTGMDEDTGDGTGAADIAAEYNSPGGGHNLPARGALTGKLPCYDCHDPHATAGVGANNKALIINGADTPANPYQTSDFSTVGFDGTNDRVVCYGCHDGTHTVEGVTPPDPATTAPVFPYHADVHANVGNASQNCLQNNGGCHQSPHNTDFFRCLDCHSTGVNANADPRLSDPTRADYVGHVDSEFGHVGAVLGNDLLSFHTINYDVSADMSVADNNGCLKCHDTRGGPTNAMLKDDDGNYYTGSRANAFSTRESLSYYDQFCLSCHDGGGSDYEFSIGFSFDLVDPTYGTVSFPAGTRLPPQVNNPGAGWDRGYFFEAGHGRGNGGVTGGFPWSGNAAAKVPCLECHLYHGSTAYKLLPGDRDTADGVGHVVKGKAYPRETVATKFTIGGVSDSTQIDYTDYTDPNKNPRLGNVTPTRDYFRSWYMSDYLNTSPWSTYHSTGTIQTPDGVTTHFGTSGDMHDNTDVNSELACGQDAQSTTTKIGFCNACHFYSQSTDGTTDTYGWVYTHEGSVGLTDCAGNDLKSQMNFFKDCVECHDPHGSGAGSANDGQHNIYMIRRKIKHAPTDAATDVTSASSWSAVVFRSTTGADSFDEADTDNTDDLCTVCHQSAAENPDDNVDHNYRSATLASDHQVGNDCTQCHPHGGRKGTGTTNLGLIGFPQAACNGCHGFPPIAPTDVARLPGGFADCSALDADLTVDEKCENYTDGGGAHLSHLEVIRAEFGASDSARELCGPCHGDDAGSGPDHAVSGELSGTWSITSRAQVNLKERTQSSWDGMTDESGTNVIDPAEGAYGGVALPTSPPGDAVDPADSTCTGVDCHGNPPASEGLHWAMDVTDGAGDADGLGKSRVCAGCHDGDATRAQVRLYDAADNLVYPAGPGSGFAPDAARVYYATPSGYARGGHGDSGIQNEDPFIDSAPGVTTPVDCTACHDAGADHFPEAAANIHRLRNQTLEDAVDASGLCTRCHTAYNDKAGNGNPLHHPSGVAFTRPYKEPTGVNYDVPAGGEGDVDEFVMYWTDTTYTSVGNPSQVDLPRLDDIFPGQSQMLACTTCHQPHGTDLAVDVSQGGGGTYTEIPDNNMLRLRDTDNTLCEACH